MTEVGPYRNTKEIEKYIYQKIGVNTHVYHNTGRYLCVVYSVRSGDYLDNLRIPCRAIYYLQKSVLDEAVRTIAEDITP